MSATSQTQSGISIPGVTSHFLDPTGSRDLGVGRLRYLTGGTGHRSVSIRPESR